MTNNPDVVQTRPTADHRRISRLWLAGAAVAALGTWICYDAIPGINWLLWTSAATFGLLAFTQRSPQLRPTLTMCAAAAIMTGGAAITANPFMHFIILLATIVFLALGMLLSTAPAGRRITAGFAVAAPVTALGNAFLSTLSRSVEATNLVRSPRARAAVRGLAITIPILIAFALLLAVADPTLALWRNTIEELVTSWDFLPRSAFFVALMVLVLGVYGYAAAGTRDTLSPTDASAQAQRWLGSAERSILLAGVAGLLWLFMILQLSYLFGNLPQVEGSGMTFAEYARRGFGEMTIVAAASTLIIAASERYGIRGSRERSLHILTFALIVGVLFLLGSAFYRVMLYEQAYGFTTARLYAQAFMIIVAAGLVALSIEVSGELEPGRLFRRVATVAVAVLVVLIYWNHEAWIAHRNIDRYGETGKLDVEYLTRELSPDAIPAIASRLASLPEPMRSELRAAIDQRYKRHHLLDTRRWFEWNLGRARARGALEKLGVSLEIEKPPSPPAGTGERT